ncbi:MAG: ABC transporter substrate-binding protein [Chloroflexi bacterium]|nr:ABC transporter substrate-binding protein [Chloroflexota bacterium]
MHRVLSRRAALGLVIGATGAGVLAACGLAPAGTSPTNVANPPAPTSPPTAASTADTASTENTVSAANTANPSNTPNSAAVASAPTRQPKSGGTLRYGLASPLTSLWPTFSGTEGTQDIYDRLLTYDDNLQPVPALIESWELASDYTSIKLNLRKGVQYHNGREFTSDDVKYTLERATDPSKTSPLSLVGLTKGWTAETPDKYTAIFSSDQTRLSVFDLLTQLRVGDKDTLDGADNKSKANGTGPFVMTDWTPGESVTLTRNKNYWRSGLPYLDGYNVLFSRDGQAMIASLEAGASDFVNYPLASEAIRLSKDPRYSMQAIYDVGSHYAIWMNVAVPPLDNKVVRQALNYAIDRQRFIDTALGGLVGPPMNLPWPTYSPAYEASKNSTYLFDLDKARALLTSAGVTGFDTVITYATVGEVTEFSTMAQIYQADLATIGVNATLQPLDNATWTDAAVKAAYQGLAVGHPGGFGAQDATSGLQTGAFGVANTFTNFSSPEYTQTVQAAAAEIDPTARRQLYSKINDIILDNCFTMPLCSLLQVSLSTAKVHGIVRDRSGGGLTLTSTWME